jgi:hypothetical protein
MKKFTKVLLVAVSVNFLMSAAWAQEATRATGESTNLDCTAGTTRGVATSSTSSSGSGETATTGSAQTGN